MISATFTEQKMLTRLEKAGEIRWVVLSGNDTRTLGRLTRKGLAIESKNAAGERIWVVAKRGSLNSEK